MTPSFGQWLRVNGIAFTIENQFEFEETGPPVVTMRKGGRSVVGTMDRDCFMYRSEVDFVPRVLVWDCTAQRAELLLALTAP